MNATAPRTRPTLVTRASGSEIVQVLGYDRCRDEVVCLIQDVRSAGGEYGYAIDTLSVEQIGVRNTTESVPDMVAHKARVIVGPESELIRGR